MTTTDERVCRSGRSIVGSIEEALGLIMCYIASKSVGALSRGISLCALYSGVVCMVADIIYDILTENLDYYDTHLPVQVHSCFVYPQDASAKQGRPGSI